jgi:hypothetical protein
MLQLEAELTDMLGPAVFDVCPTQITIVTRTWSGGRKDAGTATDSSLALPAKFPIRPLKVAEIASSGGVYEMGDLLVDLITPNDGVHNPGVGFTEAQLAPRAVAHSGVEVLYVLTGQHAGEYHRVELRSSDPFVWQLVLGRKRTKPLVTTP